MRKSSNIILSVLFFAIASLAVQGDLQKIEFIAKATAEQKVKGTTVETFDAIQDSLVKSGWPEARYGSANYVEVAFNEGVGPEGYSSAYIEFDISSIPSNATINSAELKLHLVSLPCTGEPNVNDLAISMNNAPWNENSITWNTRPESTDIKSYFSTTCPEEGTYNSTSITHIVLDWLNGTQTNNGLVLYPVGVPSEPFLRWFSTKESSNPAKLVITYTTPDSGPSFGSQNNGEREAGTTHEGGGSESNESNTDTSNNSDGANTTDSKTNNEADIEETESRTAGAVKSQNEGSWLMYLMIASVILGLLIPSYIYRKKIISYIRK